MDRINETKERLLRVAGELLTLADQTGPSSNGSLQPTSAGQSSQTSARPMTSSVIGSSSGPSSVTFTTGIRTAASVSNPTRTVAGPPLHAREHRRVFNYKGKSSHSGKGKAPLAKKIFFLKFFCLGDPNEDRPPTSVSSRTSLSNAGLGPATLSISDDVSLHGELLKTFPSLSSAGGYELLLYQRGGDDRGFHNIPTPHTASKVKALANQAVVYIRPLQMDISAVAGSSTSSYNSEPSPTVKCFQCSKEVAMDNFRDHQEQEHPSFKRKMRIQTLALLTYVNA